MAYDETPLNLTCSDERAEPGKDWSSTGSEFCTVSRDAGVKRKQRLMKV